MDSFISLDTASLHDPADDRCNKLYYGGQRVGPQRNLSPPGSSSCQGVHRPSPWPVPRDSSRSTAREECKGLLIYGSSRQVPFQLSFSADTGVRCDLPPHRCGTAWCVSLAVESWAAQGRRFCLQPAPVASSCVPEASLPLRSPRNTHRAHFGPGARTRPPYLEPRGTQERFATHAQRAFGCRYRQGRSQSLSKVPTLHISQSDGGREYRQ